MALPVLASATRSSYKLWRLSQNSALVPKKCAKRRAVSPRDRALPVQNLCHAIRGHLEPSCEFSRTHLQRVKFFGQVLPWVNGDACHSLSP